MKTNYIYNYNIAILIPCYNEEKSIKTVIESFKYIIPSAKIYVFDNNSKDNTYKIALKAGANVRKVNLAGKGNVVRRMFADIDADIYALVDGDATYDAPSLPILISKLISENLDMVVGCRKEDSKNNNNYRKGHRLGNIILTNFVAKIFNGGFTDMLSGYRVFSNRFVKSFGAESRGFEIETELTVHTLEMRIPYGEVSTPYKERPAGSASKLSTYKDGFKIFSMILRLYSSERPLYFWGIVGSLFTLLSLVLFIPVFWEYLDTKQVQRFPTLIVVIGFLVIGFLSYFIGIILRTVTKGRKESKHLAFLSIPSLKNDNQ